MAAKWEYLQKSGAVDLEELSGLGWELIAVDSGTWVFKRPVGGTGDDAPAAPAPGSFRFLDVLQRCKGDTVVINNGEQRTLLDVQSDFLVLQGGNPQMKITEFVAVDRIVRMIRADYSTGGHSLSLELAGSGADHRSVSH